MPRFGQGGRLSFGAQQTDDEWAGTTNFFSTPAGILEYVGYRTYYLGTASSQNDVIVPSARFCKGHLDGFYIHVYIYVYVESCDY